MVQLTQETLEPPPASAATAQADAPSPDALPVTIIRPTRGFASLQLGELWAYRELLFFLAWRDVKVRYRQTVLGAAWAVLQPFLTMVVFALFFGQLARIPSDGLPYPVFAFVALVPWQFFATGLNAASNSLVGNSHLIRKVYFPRLAFPIAPLGAAMVDFALAFGVLLLMQLWYGRLPGVEVLALPLLLALLFATTLGTGLWLAALNVEYRDVRFVVPFLTQIWLFATPVAYPASLVPVAWQWVYALNPMVGAIEGFRWAMLDGRPFPAAMLAVSTCVAAMLLTGGLFYFRRMERTFADLV